MILLSLLLGWALERAQMVISAPNYNSLFNGYGVMELVNRREAKAPMAYRVLVPWLVLAIERAFKTAPKTRVMIYEALKGLLAACAIYAVWRAWSLPVALCSCVLWLLTFKFDYWDWAAEVAGIAFAMSGSFPLALFGAVLHGLSRETALLVPVAFYFAGGSPIQTLIVASVTCGVLLGVRLIVGKRPLYCERWQIKYNLDLFKGFFKWKPVYFGEVFIAAVISVLALAACVSLPSGWLIPLALLVAGWSMAKADETRIFAGCIPWIAALLIGA